MMTDVSRLRESCFVFVFVFVHVFLYDKVSRQYCKNTFEKTLFIITIHVSYQYSLTTRG